jgi:hypothetical protein
MEQVDAEIKNRFQNPNQFQSRDLQRSGTETVNLKSE